MPRLVKVVQQESNVSLSLSFVDSSAWTTKLVRVRPLLYARTWISNF